MLSIIYEQYYKWRLVESHGENTEMTLRAERAVQGTRISLETVERKQSEVNGYQRRDIFD